MFTRSSRRLFVIYAGRFYGLLFLLNCACSNRQQTRVVYDESSLKQFVLATPNESDSIKSHQLDSILQTVSTDSVVLRQTILYLEPPFSNPNSAYRSAPLYSQLLQAKLQSPWYNDDEHRIA